MKDVPCNTSACPSITRRPPPLRLGPAASGRPIAELRSTGHTALVRQEPSRQLRSWRYVPENRMASDASLLCEPADLFNRTRPQDSTITPRRKRRGGMPFPPKGPSVVIDAVVARFTAPTAAITTADITTTDTASAILWAVRNADVVLDRAAAQTRQWLLTVVVAQPAATNARRARERLLTVVVTQPPTVRARRAWQHLLAIIVAAILLRARAALLAKPVVPADTEDRLRLSGQQRHR